MIKLKSVFAFLVVLVVSAVGSTTSVSASSAENQLKSEIQDRLSLAAKDVSKSAMRKTKPRSKRFAQWYNWNNWHNWNNWPNW